MGTGSSDTSVAMDQNLSRDSPAQKKALLTLLCSLKQDYPDAEIVGHCELEGVHKACPSFPVSELRVQMKQLGY